MARILGDCITRQVAIMYTTWQDKYDLLAPFGDMLDR